MKGMRFLSVSAALCIFDNAYSVFSQISSVKKITEHRETKNPVSHTDDFKLKTGDYKNAPITLVRLIIAKRPLSEKQIVTEIFRLGIFSGVLAIITAFMMGVEV